jgi:DNA-binding MarR family transcriptional regulator
MRKKPVASIAGDVAAGSADSLVLLDDQLCFALYAASLSMTRLYRPALAEIGLTYPQFLVLLALREQAGITVGALGNRVALDSGTLTPLLKRMETAGFVTRLRNPLDEREVCISLTVAGRAAHRKALIVQHKAGCATGLSAASARRLTVSLTRLRKTLLEAGDTSEAADGAGLSDR